MSATTETLSEDTPELSSKETPTELSKDKIFHILQTQRRRDALRYLKNNDGSVEMRALAEQVAAWENDTTVAALASDERQRVYIALYQSHLPKLDKEGVIDYNQSRGIVERGSLADQFDPYLEARSDDNSKADDDADKQWFRYYHWATAASAGTLAATWLGLPFVGSLTSSVLGALVVCVYAAIATLQLTSR
ncbi:hypothetical protein DMJ13_16950 [halophilic archaeon]|nr:hypothetical protein DMJ13_16950 [halophilic archaeon]